MRAAIFGGPGDITVGERPDPTIQRPTDVIVRVVFGWASPETVEGC
jgi:threonine dehydrogenase-like Zn-dependent dehydrogenase